MIDLNRICITGTILQPPNFIPGFPAKCFGFILTRRSWISREGPKHEDSVLSFATVGEVAKAMEHLKPGAWVLLDGKVGKVGREPAIYIQTFQELNDEEYLKSAALEKLSLASLESLVQQKTEQLQEASNVISN